MQSKTPVTQALPPCGGGGAVIIALPVELSRDQNIALMRQFVFEQVLARGQVAEAVRAVGGSLLAAASLAVQGQADVHIDGRVLPLSLWLLAVAESGERKTAVDAIAMRAARRVPSAIALMVKSRRAASSAWVP